MQCNEGVPREDGIYFCVTSSRSSLVTLLLLSAIALLLVAHRLHIAPPTGNEFWSSGDAYQYFLPNASFLRAELRQGNLPIWNPFQLAGQPFLGLHVPAVLYPPNLIAFGLLGAARGLELLFVAHMVIAGFFTWLFAKRVGSSDLAALTAAVTYALSIPVVLGLYQPAMMSGNAWLPAVLWSLHGLTSARRLRWAWALGLLLALVFLSGHSQGFVYQVQFAACYGVFAWLTLCPREHRWVCVGLAAAAAGLAFALVAPQLLPALELTKEAVRGFGGIPFEETILLNGLPLFPAPHQLLDGLLGALGSALGRGLTEFSLPALTAPLLAAGIFSRRHRRHWVMFSLSFLVVALISLGPRTPVYRLYYELPFGNLFRQVARMSFIYTFLASMLLGIGVDAVCERLHAAGVAPRRVLAAGGLLLALAGGDAYARAELPWIHPAARGETYGPPAEFVESLRALGHSGRIFVETMGAASGWRFFNAKLGTMTRLPIVPDYEPNPPGRYARFFDVPASPPWHGGLRLSGGKVRALAIGLIPLFDLMSVRHYAVPTSARQATDLLSALFGSPPRVVGDMAIFERKQALPRTYLVHRLVLAPHEDAVMGLLKTGGFRPHEEVVVVDPTSEAGSRARLGSGRKTEGERADLVAHGIEDATVDARCESSCMLVLTDLDYPGWRAYVAGREIPIRRVNLLFRGVELPPGDHRVEYRYEPRSFRIGLTLAAVGIATAGVLTIRARRRQR